MLKLGRVVSGYIIQNLVDRYIICNISRYTAFITMSLLSIQHVIIQFKNLNIWRWSYTDIDHLIFLFWCNNILVVINNRGQTTGDLLLLLRLWQRRQLKSKIVPCDHQSWKQSVKVNWKSNVRQIFNQLSGENCDVAVTFPIQQKYWIGLINRK